MSELRIHRKNLLDSVYAVDGIIVVNGLEGQAISSPDPEQPLKVKGSELAKLGLDLVSLLKSEMILPVTNQTLVDEALRYFEEVEYEFGKNRTSGLVNDKGRRVAARRNRVRRNHVND
jgi:hypothetical protein